MHPRSLARPAAAFIYMAFAVIAPGFLRAEVTLAWDPDSDPAVVGYRLHSGTTSGVYTQTMEAGNATSILVSNLVAGQTYYFAVTAYNSSAVESAFSNQVSYTAPGSSPTPTPTPSPTAGPSPTPTPTSSPSATPTPTPVPTPSLTPTPTPSPTPSPSISPSPSVTPSPTPTPGTGVARMISPVPGSTFTSSTVTFTWTRGGASNYGLFVGSAPFSTNYYGSIFIRALSCTATN